jgi:hypothetical protein
MKTKVRGPIDPYRMNPYNVRTCHFENALLYDQELVSSGLATKNCTEWKISKQASRKKYREWLAYQRSFDTSFRRFPVLLVEEVLDNEGNTYRTKEIVQCNNIPEGAVRQYNNGNVYYLLELPDMIVTPNNSEPQKIFGKTGINIACSKIKGASPDSDGYVPKMFTAKMGRKILQARNYQKLTQQQVADKLNMNVGIVRDIELGDILSFNEEVCKKLRNILQMESLKYEE